MRQHADPTKESVTDPFLTPPEAFEKDQLDLYQPENSNALVLNKIGPKRRIRRGCGWHD